MTANKAIERVDRVKPNAYEEEDKFRWINDLDGMIQRLVMQIAEPTIYSYPDDMDTELLVKGPWEDLYTLYLESMIDYHNREFQNYNNSASMFAARFDEFKKLYIRETLPKSYGTIKL